MEKYLRMILIFTLVAIFSLAEISLPTTTWAGSKAIKNNSPIKVNLVKSKPIYRVNSKNELEEIMFQPGYAKVIKVNNKRNRYELLSTTRIIIKTRQLSPKDVSLVKNAITNGTLSNYYNTNLWDQTYSFNATFTLDFREHQLSSQSVGEIPPLIVHYDTINVYVNYKDSQVIAKELALTFSSMGDKYRENYDGTFTLIKRGDTYYGFEKDYENILQGNNYSSFNSEVNWVNVAPESAHALSHNVVELTRGGSTWYFYVNYDFSGGSMQIETNGYY